MRKRILLVAVAAAFVGSACSTVVPQKAPLCDAQLRGEVLLIESQSVPTAEMVPCVGALPVGWSFQGFEVSDKGTTFYLDSDRAGAHAVQVDLKKTCDTSGASEIPPDTPGARTFERIPPLSNRYAGVRYYVFKGGCVTYEFDFTGTGRTELAREVSLALDFFPVDDLRSVVAEREGER